MSRFKISNVLILLMLTGVAMLVGVLMIYPNPNKTKCDVCGWQINDFGMALIAYAHESDDNRLPPLDQWCDLLLIQNHINPRQFNCKGSDAVEGESSYAINKNVAGLNLSQIPQDIVVLFETEYGKDPNGRNEMLMKRRWHKVLRYGSPDKEVYKNRWNQSGGPEILTTAHHNGKGCNVFFGDRSVRFVETKGLPELKWEVDETVIKPLKTEIGKEN